MHRGAKLGKDGARRSPEKNAKAGQPMRDFSYHAPSRLAEAQTLHAEAPLHTRFLAGGTDLFLFLEQGGADIRTVIDLKAIPGSAEIQQGADGGLRLGALTTMRALELADTSASPLELAMAPQPAEVMIEPAAVSPARLATSSTSATASARSSGPNAAVAS